MADKKIYLVIINKITLEIFLNRNRMEIWEDKRGGGSEGMLTFFNRKEVLLTFDLDYLSKARSKLKQNDIEYYAKVVNRNSSTRGSFGASRRASLGTLGQKINYTYEYHLYVHKKDFDETAYLIRSL